MKYHFKILVFLVLLVHLPISSEASTNSKNIHDPICLAGFCIMNKQISFDYLKKEFGYSQKSIVKDDSDEQHSIKYCYYDEKQNSYIEFAGYTKGWNNNNISEIIVSAKPFGNCKEWYKSNKKFLPFETKKKIKIGNNLKQLMSIYGQANLKKIDNETFFLSYEIEPNQIFSEPYISFKISKDIITEIHLVNGP